MNIFTLSLFLVAVLAEDYDAPRGRGNQRGCVFPTNVPPNLIIRMQGKGRIMRFLCSTGALLIGKRFSTCLRGRWSSPPPICISKGCPPQTAPPNGWVSESYDGAMLTFGCNPGYVQNGSGTIYCALHQWNGTAPTCNVPTINPNVSCDFEDPDMCGWSHDVSHDFEWKRNRFSTPSGHVGTGPSFDHTLGKGLHGHYMYLEASAPQKEGDITRLFSPVHPTVLSGSCFTFWYHMYGSSIGSLRVYLKEENQVLAELTPVWSKGHETGNIWLQGQIDIPQLSTNFQLIIEGVRGADYMGDIAVDDVILNPGSCPVQTNQSEPIQGNVTSATTLKEGGGAEETESQNITHPTTAAFTREVTTNLSLTTVTEEPRIVGTTTPISSGILSTMTSSSSNTNEVAASTSNTSKVDPTSVKTETTTALTPPQQPDCVIDTSNSTQSTDQNFVISLYNCSTEPRIDTSKTTQVFRTTEVTTVDNRYTTIPPAAVTTITSTPRKITQTSAYLSSTELLSTTTINPTTKSRFIFPKFTKQTTKMTITSFPIASTTMQSMISESNLSDTTKRFPFIIKNPTSSTSASTTAPTTSPTTTTTTTTTTITTTTTTTRSLPTTAATTTKIFVPTTGSSKLTATTESSKTTTKATASPATTTTKATASPGTTTTSTRKPFIYIVPKTARTVTNNPLALGNTTQTVQFKSTFPLSPRTNEASTQYTTSTKESTTKQGIPPKQITTPTSTTDIRSLFPDSTEEEDTDEDEEEHSGQNDDNIVSDDSIESVKESDTSARWQEFPRKPHPRVKGTSGAGVSALATACSLGALALVVSAFTIIYLVRRRKLNQQRYGSNSEMRYITQSEELELGLPDNSDNIKLL